MGTSKNQSWNADDTPACRQAGIKQMFTDQIRGNHKNQSHQRFIGIHSRVNRGALMID